MPHVIVEQSHDPPATPEAVQAQLAQLRKCLTIREVQVVAVYVAENGRRVIHVLQARDAESVRNGFRSAGIAFERAWSATPYAP